MAEEVKKIEQADGSVTIEFGQTIEGLAKGPNLVDQLNEDKLAKIGDMVVTDYEIDLRSRASWEVRRGNWYKLFAQHRDLKTHPWANCSNVAIPTLGVSILQFHARAFDALFSQKEIVRGFHTDGKTKDSAIRVGKHMNYQLTQEMSEWEEDMDTMLIQLPLNGSSFKKTYYDRLLKRPVSRFIAVDDFVAPYSARTLEDAVRKTHVLRPYNDEIKRRMESGEYATSEQVLNHTPSLEQAHSTSTEMGDAKEKVSGMTASTVMESPASSPKVLLEQHRTLDLNEDGVGEHYIVTVHKDTKKVLRIESREYVDKNGLTQIVENFTHYIFIPNPEGLYAFGFGHLLEGLNESINTIINQLIDAGTLANLQGGFVNVRSGIKTGDLKFERGEFKKVEIASDDIKKAIFQFQFSPPSDVLFKLLGLLQDYANKISSVSDSMMGQLPPSDTTATTMMAVLEQGLKVFSTIQKRIHRSLKRELQKIFLINSVYLDEETYFTVQDSGSQEFLTLKTGREDYSSGIDVIPTSDPNIVSKAERLIKVKEAWQFAQTNPDIMNDPDARYEISKQYLVALEMEGVERIVKKPEPQGPPPDLPPQEENAGFLKEVKAELLPEQDHQAHYAEHLIFRDSEWGQALSPQGKKLLEAHIKDTLAAMYLATTGGVDGNTGTTGPLEGAAGDTSLLEEAGGAAPLGEAGGLEAAHLGGVSGEPGSDFGVD